MNIRTAYLISFFLKIFKVCFAVLFIFFYRASHCSVLNPEAILFDKTARIEDVRKAIQEGVNIETRNSSGFTPLLFACYNANKERAELYLKAGAQLEARMPDPDKRTPLHMAISTADQEGGGDLVAILLDRGASLDSVEQRGNLPIHWLVRIDDLTIRMRVLTELLMYGADINSKGEDGNTVLHMHIKKFDFPGVVAMRDLFGIELDLQVRNNRGFTPQAYADDFLFTDIEAELGKPPVVAGLVHSNVNIYDANGLTALMHAVIGNKEDMVKELIDTRGANPNLAANNPFGFTAFEIALLRKNFKLATLLINKKANIDIQDGRGKTAFHLLLVMADPVSRGQVLDFLIKAGGNIWVKDSRGNTLLHDVVLRNDQALLNYIIKNHKKLFSGQPKNNAYQTPLELARAQANSKMVKLLESLYA